MKINDCRCPKCGSLISSIVEEKRVFEWGTKVRDGDGRIRSNDVETTVCFICKCGTKYSCPIEGEIKNSKKIKIVICNNKDTCPLKEKCFHAKPHDYCEECEIEYLANESCQCVEIKKEV